MPLDPDFTDVDDHSLETSESDSGGSGDETSRGGKRGRALGKSKAAGSCSKTAKDRKEVVKKVGRSHTRVD